mgnify:CR=1 FL=1
MYQEGSARTDEKLSYEYIRGLIEGEGSFTFSTTPVKLPNGRILRKKYPAFAIGMHERDEKLLYMVKNTLGLKNRIYNYKDFHKDGYKRGRKVVLIVREFGQLKNIIIPFFYKRLKGNKGRQFEEWLEKIGTDPEVSESFKFIHKIYKAGFYDKNPKFLN